eukprot:SAG31_NODE_3430_length_4261_cov_2.188382_3_plen_100_part_00
MARTAAEVLKFNGVRNRLPLRKKRVFEKNEERPETVPKPEKPAWKLEWERAVFDPARERRQQLVEYLQWFFMLALIAFIIYCLMRTSKGTSQTRRAKHS